MTIEIDLDALEAAIKAVSSMHWAQHPLHKKAVYDPLFECWLPQTEDDAAYIAAANPAVVAELIHRLREAEKDAARLNRLEEVIKASSYSIQFQRLRDPAIKAGMNRIKFTTGVGSGPWVKTCEDWSLRSVIDAAMGEPK